MQNDIINELGQNFIEYAVAVNTDRSIPDTKSGLKPVARRILYGALDSGYTSNKAHVKAARLVGDVMGRLHPHGDSSIYGALVRLSQNWVMRYPLIDFHGNNGNITGDDAASMRYTEVRLSKLTEDGLLSGLKKNNVDFIPTYDESDEEPITLPAVFPNLLCNPNEGIGVAMACKWAPHNLKEVAQAIEDYLEGKEPMLPGPDFPTGGVVINKDDIPSIMRTGHGSVKIRGKYKVEKNNLVFVPTLSGNIRALDDLEHIPSEYYSRFKDLFDSIVDGTFKNVKVFASNSPLYGITEVRGFKVRVVFTRLSSDTYAIITAFVKKSDKDKLYNESLNNIVREYRGLEASLKANLNNPEFMKENEKSVQQLWNILAPKNEAARKELV